LRRYLLLEDGESFEGKAFGSLNETYGELVFNTSFTGFYEVMTDPSYGGQIVVFNFPSMFYYEYEKDMLQSNGISAQGIVVKDGFKPSGTGFDLINAKMIKDNIPGIYGIDTRKLVKKIRDSGNLKGIISNENKFDTKIPEIDTDELIRRFSTKKPYVINGGNEQKILYIDMGTKSSLLEQISKFGEVQVTNIFNLPSNYNDFDCIFLSNGPGDPRNDVFNHLKADLRKNLGNVPMVGVCLGHQIIGEVLGGKIEKMPFGHHGSNHAVSDGIKSYITSHNHNYRISEDSLDNRGINITLKDLNDGTVEMITDQTNSIISVQFHPEGNPGPVNSTNFFEQVGVMINEIKL
jgi:carbamoyl-phosphate synthase small subunit